MVYLALLALVLGVLYGLSGLTFLDLIVEYNVYFLYLLLIVVGISVGLDKGLFKKMKQYGLKIFLIPLATIVATILGGIVCSFILHIDMNISTAISCGFGWYSLSGIMITELTNATYGSITFLSSLMRETFSFILIPILAKHLNYMTAIAPCAATSIDTTLSMINKYTDEETTILSIMNGFIISTSIPFLIKLCFKIF